MQLTHVFVFVATVVASVNALATPVHGVRMSHRHSTIAKARAPAPEAAISSPFASKRGLKKRCKPRTSTSSLVLPSGIANAGNAPVTSSVEATSAPAPAPTSEAPAPAPTTSSKTKAAPTTSEAPAPAPTSEAPAPAPTTSSKTKAAPTTTQAPAPPPTSEAPAPAPTTSSKKPTSSSQAPQTTQASSGGSPISGLGQFAGTLSGQGTWYDTGLTACGVTNNDSEFIAAVSHLMFDTFPGYAGTNPNNNPICGRKAQVTYQGKTITVTITDRCTACAVEDLDFTPTAFQQLAPLGAGRISGVSWHFIS